MGPHFTGAIEILASDRLVNVSVYRKAAVRLLNINDTLRYSHGDRTVFGHDYIFEARSLPTFPRGSRL